MDVLHSTRLYILLPWLYFSLLDSTLLHHGSTSLYWTLNHSTAALLHSTRLFVTLPWLYFTLHCSSMTLHLTTLLYEGLTSLYFDINLPWLSFTILVSTSHLNASTSLYLTLHHSPMALLHST